MATFHSLGEKATNTLGLGVHVCTVRWPSSHSSLPCPESLVLSFLTISAANLVTAKIYPFLSRSLSSLRLPLAKKLAALPKRPMG